MDFCSFDTSQCLLLVIYLASTAAASVSTLRPCSALLADGTTNIGRAQRCRALDRTSITFGFLLLASFVATTLLSLLYWYDYRNAAARHAEYAMVESITGGPAGGVSSSDYYDDVDAAQPRTGLGGGVDSASGPMRGGYGGGGGASSNGGHAASEPTLGVGIPPMSPARSLIASLQPPRLPPIRTLPPAAPPQNFTIE